ncbi:N-methyl-L-tryptophan oxidase [Candidatus Palauibacter soopunensis]|uniref:N-methyl-L-tryptophan oxidase n=1 Tax=Candidatus Palauibacter soopunensis TaxID=3056739 RepID=UPI0023A030DE|nr:N-methyl-L-tryptophan oxidase [Candidatus Palauibacter soopunensis]MDE2879941.1 N-methyl-L-tryptophan oxidase [Candidatus Palauibacter soopunensis]
MHDFAVIGLGAIGSATAAELVRRGHSVVGFDRYTPPHTMGSAHSDTRMIREAWYQGSPYVPLVHDACRRWKNLERSSGRTLLRTAGALMMGPEDGRAFAGSPLRGVVRPDTDYVLLSAEEVAERFPWLRPDPGTVTIYEPGAAILSLEACIEATLEAAAGADLRFDEPVLEWSTSASGVRVRTERGDYAARRLAIAAGAWTPQLLPGLSLPLEVERTVQYWFEPAGVHADVLAEGPAWVWELEREGTWYGFPPTARGLKAGMHFQAGRRTDAERVVREVGASEADDLRRLFGRYAPGVAGALAHASVCLYTNTPDEDFILDRHPGHPEVVLFAGGSGHAFKFAPVLGSLMADRLTEEPPSRDPALFSIDRFR